MKNYTFIPIFLTNSYIFFGHFFDEMRGRELTIPIFFHFLKSDKKQGFCDGNSKKELKNANI
jgi:hypothetical protein